jgi:four helix bundle protein
LKLEAGSGKREARSEKREARSRKREADMDFEKLKVWQRAVKLSTELYIKFRSLNDFGFKDQVTRSGLSVPSNIAEGMSRQSVKDKVKFLIIAKSSCAELRTQLYIGIEVGYVDNNIGREWISETREIASMLSGLIRTLTRGQ